MVCSPLESLPHLLFNFRCVFYSSPAVHLSLLSFWTRPSARLICSDQSVLPYKCPHSSPVSFPPWAPTLTRVIFPPSSPLFKLHPDYPFLPLVTLFPISCRFMCFFLNTEWPLLVEDILAGSNGTSFSSLGDIKREISLALATLWQTLCLGAIFAPCSPSSRGK